MTLPWISPETQLLKTAGVGAKATVQQVVSTQLLEAGIDPQQVSVVGHVAVCAGRWMGNWWGKLVANYPRIGRWVNQPWWKQWDKWDKWEQCPLITGVNSPTYDPWDEPPSNGGSHPPFILNTPFNETMVVFVRNFHIPWRSPCNGRVFQNRGMGLLTMGEPWWTTRSPIWQWVMKI